jgi:hypothetical protein
MKLVSLGTQTPAFALTAYPRWPIASSKIRLGSNGSHLGLGRRSRVLPKVYQDEVLLPAFPTSTARRSRAPADLPPPPKPKAKPKYGAKKRKRRSSSSLDPLEAAAIEPQLTRPPRPHPSLVSIPADQVPGHFNLLSMNKLYRLSITNDRLYPSLFCSSTCKYCRLPLPKHPHATPFLPPPTVPHSQTPSLNPSLRQ